MTTSQPRLIAQSYDGVTTSTSPSVTPPAPVPHPRTMMQVGTSALAQGALLLVLLAHDAAPAQHSMLRTETQHGAAVQAAPAVPTARSSEMVKTIIAMFGLNRSQAADVMQVRRQSVYNWLGGSEAEGANLDRMVLLYGVAKSLANPIEPHLAVRSTPDGTNNLLRMLSADQLDRDAILAWTTALHEPSDAPWPQPLDDILREAGAERNPERERQRGADGVRYLQG